MGSKTSSNSNRLRELAQKLGARAYLVDDEGDLRRLVEVEHTGNSYYYARQ